MHSKCFSDLELKVDLIDFLALTILPSILGLTLLIGASKVFDYVKAKQKSRKTPQDFFEITFGDEVK